MRRCAMIAAFVLPASALAQDAGAPDGGGVIIEAAPVEVEPGPELPVAPEPPPMPADDATFGSDRALFREATTPAEALRDARLAEEAAPIRPDAPLYERHPALAWVSLSAAGIFGAGTIGLLGGRIGDSIDDGDDSAPLGGMHGPAIGAVTGSVVGTSLAIWGGGLLFEKDTPYGWTLLGTGLGTVVGGAAAFGIAEGMSRGDTSSALAVGTFAIFQVGGALLFNHLFRPGRPRPRARARVPVGAELSPRRAR